ncbi:MCP four helix bundle domain-containing protein [Telmatospirillum sp.]|uniref:MCP four helix bundle domain-containing protein n=1 Tax=Telmatospirillum sp. TaxID=2079197 RepID=UPI0028512838|nr:MCP four helix bundle domain-containing protein [Telmatospirillum sp.]MDR3440903.1 MCP four helix bundle domain-containing protein [Telmatospirillum sp.]
MTASPPPKPLSRFVRRVTACFALLFVLTWANGIFAIAQLGRIDSESRDAIDGGMASTAVLGQLAASISAYRLLEASQLLEPRARDDRTPRDDDRKSLLVQIEKAARQYESLDSSDEEKRLFMKFLTGWYDYQRHSQSVFATLSAGDSRAAAALFAANRPIFESADATIGELIHITIGRDHVIEEDLHGIFRSSLWFLLAAVAGISLLIVAIVLAVAWHDQQ